MHGIRWEIAFVLALKLAALSLLYFLFFAHDVPVTPHAVAAHVLGG